jgi:hypothetical protein
LNFDDCPATVLVQVSIGNQYQYRARKKKSVGLLVLFFKNIALFKNYFLEKIYRHTT